jgi:hypothetical protein
MLLAFLITLLIQNLRLALPALLCFSVGSGVPSLTAWVESGLEGGGSTTIDASGAGDDGEAVATGATELGAIKRLVAAFATKTAATVKRSSIHGNKAKIAARAHAKAFKVLASNERSLIVFIFVVVVVCIGSVRILKVYDSGVHRRGAGVVFNKIDRG